MRQCDTILDPFDGRLMQGGLVFRQSFTIRSYELGTDYRASMEALMNYLQETALNHCRSIELLADGFGSTPEMCKRDLVWVTPKLQIVVDSYPLWNSIVEVDTWMVALGRNGMHREWLIRDLKTGKTMVKAVSMLVMMNKETRRIAKFTKEIRLEIERHTMNQVPIIVIDSTKMRPLNAKTADYVRTGLTPRWNDLDVNNHVNNVKYINWILEAIPRSIWEDHEFHGVNIEYRRECRRDSLLRTLSTGVRDGPGHTAEDEGIEFDHLLLLENGLEIARARTKWRPRCSAATRNSFQFLGGKAQSRDQDEA
ncbi:palmitoyl-acyl carrier protein thioesterase, chloroplastic-like [Syzygium oleosum]|uniref:palmitoyl-acyl carrier protein thioesterase, chloroplastic-like n=1 Tax=Syzygium oleosum TaxID=219896 RepID=UPI0011D2BE4F|nr:palmitoyl-acyl carrier protein thioesterase, chloroplastic-like [Syzygium oleosum]